MSRRSRAREVVLQVLYQDDLNPEHSMTFTDEFLRGRLRGFPQLVDFANDLLAGVRRHRLQLDEILTRRAENWSLTRMAATDRNVMRLGAYEILYSETPNRVAINEALELAKRFGGENSTQFVNGILDRVLQEPVPPHDSTHSPALIDSPPPVPETTEPVPRSTPPGSDD